jgi:hypothetical protein
MLGILHKVAASLETRLVLQEIRRSSEPEARNVVSLALFSARGNAEGWLELFSPWEKFS